MAEYKDMYFKLYGKVTDVRDMLNDILLELEDEYIGCEISDNEGDLQ